MGRGFWVAWLGSQALPWTVCWAQGGEILWAWGPIGKWKESQDDKAAHYHCPLHHTLKISCGPSACPTTQDLALRLLLTLFMQNIRKNSAGLIVVKTWWNSGYGYGKWIWKHFNVYKTIWKGRGSKNIVDLDTSLWLCPRGTEGWPVCPKCPWGGGTFAQREPGPFPISPETSQALARASSGPLGQSQGPCLGWSPALKEGQQVKV